MRAVDEWVGKNDDTAIPPRVKLRIFTKYAGRCGTCTLLIIGKLRPAYDHIVAICNGGENRESNLILICDICHKEKTKGDVAVKAVTARVRANFLGLKKPKGRPMPGTKRSGLRKRLNGTVERR